MGYSVRQIAERIGKSKSYVGTLLSIVRYADVEEAVRTADIPVRTAEELAKIEDAEERRHYLQRVLAGKLDREGLIAARRQDDSLPVPSVDAGQTVRSADSPPSLIPTIGRAYRALERQRARQVPVEEKGEAIQLLRRLIAQANQLLAELERE